jgi:hypothetical protein
VPVNSRAKGARGEREFIARHLAPYWPEAKRNLDQFGLDKRDALSCAGVHWQIKYQERLNIWLALAQAEREATGGDLPIVAFRRARPNRWFCALDAEALVALLGWGLEP